MRANFPKAHSSSASATLIRTSSKVPEICRSSVAAGQQDSHVIAEHPQGAIAHGRHKAGGLGLHIIAAYQGAEEAGEALRS